MTKEHFFPVFFLFLFSFNSLCPQTTTHHPDVFSFLTSPHLLTSGFPTCSSKAKSICSFLMCLPVLCRLSTPYITASAGSQKQEREGGQKAKHEMGKKKKSWEGEVTSWQSPQRIHKHYVIPRHSGGRTGNCLSGPCRNDNTNFITLI